MRRNPTRSVGALVVVLGLAAGVAAAQEKKPGAKGAAGAAGAAAGGATFVDITAEAGIDFTHEAGAFGKKYLPETMGAGGLFIDFDGDGWQDILLLNGHVWPEKKEEGGEASTPVLYRNTGKGKFEDVTEKAGLAVEMYSMGGAVGDYDNDGDDDLYVSNLYEDKLFRNRGDGTFEDVTESSGISNPDWGTSCAFLDYNKDGHLDLFVANYVQWSIETDIVCKLDGKNKSYCTPESYKGVSPRLFRNKGDGTFVDATKQAQVHSPTSKSLGIAVFDYDGDGWQDMLVANDTEPNKLYKNNGDGTFIEKGTEAGIAFSESGQARGAMGLDAADYDGSGMASVVIGNFSNEMIGLYHNEGDGFFIDEAPVAGVGRQSLLTLAFACFFLDFDLDGALDIFAGNGHVEDDINKVQRRVTFAQPPHLFRGDGEGKFADVVKQVGPDLQRPIVARGGAWADIDNDGDPDLLVTTNRGPAYLFRNDGSHGNHWLAVKTVGKKSNRNGIGARVTVHAGGQRHTLHVRSGISYCSQSQLPLLFGLGKTAKVDKVEVAWPDRAGTVDVIPNPPVDAVLVVEEGSHPRAGERK